MIARMIPRRILPALTSAVDEASALALLGPRQAGKTTLALDVARARPAVYLDLESDADRAKLSEAELYLSQHEDKLVILDEIRRAPWAIEIKRGLAPKIERGFHLACDAVRPGQRRVVYGGIERFPLAEGAEVVSLVDLWGELSEA